MNVDNSEVKKFNDLASRWWDKESEFKPLHQINPLRLKYIKKKCNNNLYGKKILDVGCGGGILAESLAKEGAIVSAIDIGASTLEVAKLHLLESKLDIDYKLITVEELAKQQTASFDIICCLEMLEHVPDVASIIQSCAKLLNNNGMIFFSTINRNIKSYLFAIIGAEYILHLLPKGTHDFNKFIRPSELDVFARSANLRLIDITGMTYNPIIKKYKISTDINVNYLTYYQKL